MKYIFYWGRKKNKIILKRVSVEDFVDVADIEELTTIIENYKNFHNWSGGLPIEQLKEKKNG